MQPPRQFSTYGWIFHESEYTGKVYACKREDIHTMFNDINNPLVLKAENFESAKEMIERTNGDKKLLKQLIK